MIRKILLMFACILVLGKVGGQTLDSLQPEQDPCNALILCGLTYTNPFSYVGVGNTNNLPNTPCGSGESNSVWMKLTINTGGILVFTITPAAVTDDYDFAVLNGTGLTCSQLTAANVVRCNFNNNIPVSNNGVVGLSTSATATSVYSGTTGNPYVAAISANAGDVYYIMLNNAGNGFGVDPASGFTIDFSGSTATFNQDTPPHLQAIVAPGCSNSNYVKVHLTKPVLCSSVAADGSDFYVTPSATTVASASGSNCSNVNGYTSEIQVNFSSPLPPGTYTLHAAIGSDTNTLVDFCAEQLPEGETLTFNVYKLSDTVSQTICQAQLPYHWNGITVNSGGNAIAAYHANSILSGCDSVTYLNLTVLPKYDDTVHEAICPDMLPYIWHNTTVHNEGNNVAVYQTQTANGCDSVVHLNLSIIQPVQQTLNLEGCGSVSIAPYILTSDTTINDTVQSQYGCDSLYRHIAAVIHPQDPVPDTTVHAGCGNVVFNNTNYTSSVTLLDTFHTIYGCDSVYHVDEIIVYPNTPETLTVNMVGCDSLTFEGQLYSDDAVVDKMFYNVLGCDSLYRIVNIHIEHFRLSLADSPAAPVVGVVVTLYTSANVPDYTVYAWEPAGLFPNQTKKFQNFIADSTRLYWVYGKSANGCVDSDSLTVNVGPVIPEVNFPNAFSPNGDGVNDYFRPVFYIQTGYEVLYFNIYNRWGQVVYTSTGEGYQADYGWDGTMKGNGNPCATGTYYYECGVSFVNGVKKKFKGDVTLVR